MVLIYVIKLSIISELLANISFRYAILSVPICTFRHSSEKEGTHKPQQFRSRGPSESLFACIHSKLHHHSASAAFLNTATGPM